MANEKKGLEAEKAVYKKPSELVESDIRKLYTRVNAVLSSRNSRRARSVFYHTVQISIGSGLVIRADLDDAEFSIVLAERNIPEIYANIESKLPILVRLVKGKYENSEYMFAELRLCKDVIKTCMFTSTQMKLIEIRPQLLSGFLIQYKDGSSEGIGEQSDFFRSMF